MSTGAASSVGSTGLGPINFQGLVSGLNTSSIIQALVGLTTAQEAPLEAQLTGINNQNTALNTINKDLLSVLSALTPLQDSDTFLSMAANSSNTNAFNATADTTAAPGSYNLTVNSLATQTSVSSQGSISSAAQGIGSGVNNAATQTISNVLGRFADPDIQLQYAGFSTTPTSGSFTLSHDGNNATILVDNASDSLNDIINQINSSGIGVTASLSDDKLTLTADDGNAIGIGAASDTSNFLSATNLTSGVASTSGGDYTITSSVHLGAVNPTATLTQASTTLTDPAAAPTLTTDSAAGTLNAGDTYQVEVLAYNANGDLTDASPASTSTGGTEINVNFAPVAGATGYLLYVADTSAGETTYQAIDIGNNTSYTIGSHTAGDRINPAFNSTGASVANFNPGTAALTTPAAGDFTINGTTVDLTSTDTLETLLAKINSSSAQASAVYNANTDSISLENNNAGNTAISLSDTGGNFLSEAGLLGSPQNIGAQSSVTVNGGSPTFSNSNTVTNAIPGVTLNLTGTGSGTVTVSNNSSQATTAMNTLVNALNQLETDIYSNSTPPVYQGTQQTTAAGVLFGNFQVSSIQSSVEQAVIQPSSTSGSSPYQSLEDLGLTFTAKQGAANVWSLNATTLQNAIDSNPQAVSTIVNQLTTNIQTLLQGDTNTQTGIPGIVTSNNQDVTDINQQITQIQDTANSQQQALEQQFAAMESLLSTEQSTEEYLQQELGLLNTTAANFSNSSANSSSSNPTSSLLSGG